MSDLSPPVPFETGAVLFDGRQVASNGQQTLTLLDAGGRVFRRRAVKSLGGAATQRVEWAVAELNGVRVYFDGQHVVVTTQDLVP